MVLASILLLLNIKAPASSAGYAKANAPCKLMFPSHGALIDAYKDSLIRSCSFEDYNNSVSKLFLWAFNHHNGIEVIIERRLEYKCKTSEVVEIMDTRGNSSRKSMMVDTLTQGDLYTKLFYKHCQDD